MLSSPSITVALWMINFNRQKTASEGLSINEKRREKLKIIAYFVRTWYCRLSADPFHMKGPAFLPVLTFLFIVLMTVWAEQQFAAHTDSDSPLASFCVLPSCVDDFGDT